MLVNVIDVAEQKKLQEHIHHALKMEASGKLAWRIACDLNNTLSVILCCGFLIVEQL
ncbi:MAG: hypothetical protein AB2L14_24475 [Candidatus Xenobiia bacterium LiM19]